MVYQRVKLEISPKQQKTAIRGSKIRITPSCIGKGQLVMLHPINYKKVINAKGGINLELSPGELMATAAHHGLITPPTDMSGEGIFDSIWTGLKSAGRWLKDSGVATAVADVGQKLLEPVVGPEIANIGRTLVKNVTGVGVKTRGRPKGSGLYLGSKGKGLYL